MNITFYLLGATKKSYKTCKFHQFFRCGFFRTKYSVSTISYTTTRYYVPYKVFANKRKLEGKGICLCEKLMKLCLVKLTQASQQHTFGNVWSYN